MTATGSSCTWYTYNVYIWHMHHIKYTRIHSHVGALCCTRLWLLPSRRPSSYITCLYVNRSSSASSAYSLCRLFSCRPWLSVTLTVAQQPRSPLSPRPLIGHPCPGLPQSNQQQPRKHGSVLCSVWRLRGFSVTSTHGERRRAAGKAFNPCPQLPAKMDSLPVTPPLFLSLPSQPVLCHAVKNSQFCSPWTLYNYPKF